MKTHLEEKCETCNGHGSTWQYVNGFPFFSVCTSCGGSGKKSSIPHFTKYLFVIFIIILIILFIKEQFFT